MTEVSWVVTLYRLFLGDQDSVTGHFRPGFTIHAVKAAIFPEGGSWSFPMIGWHTVNNAVAFTEYDLDEGDVLLNALGQYYTIKSKKKWAVGDQLKYVEHSVEEMKNFPFLAGFFGFEDLTHGTIGCGFEDGFERGSWAL